MTGTQRYYDHFNRGVLQVTFDPTDAQKQWKDIRDKYANKDSDGGDDE
jgi:hypothetical protein